MKEHMAVGEERIDGKLEKADVACHQHATFSPAKGVCALRFAQISTS
jgi:hypothetical protein